jgi:hypothetical protein
VVLVRSDSAAGPIEHYCLRAEQQSDHVPKLSVLVSVGLADRPGPAPKGAGDL